MELINRDKILFAIVALSFLIATPSCTENERALYIDTNDIDLFQTYPTPSFNANIKCSLQVLIKKNKIVSVKGGLSGSLSIHDTLIYKANQWYIVNILNNKLVYNSITTGSGAHLVRYNLNKQKATWQCYAVDTIYKDGLIKRNYLEYDTEVSDSNFSDKGLEILLKKIKERARMYKENDVITCHILKDSIYMKHVMNLSKDNSHLFSAINNIQVETCSSFFNYVNIHLIYRSVYNSPFFTSSHASSKQRLPIDKAETLY